jgi:FHA domain
MTTMTVRPLAGPGVVARAGDLLLVCTDGGSTVSALLTALNDVARAAGDGVALVRRVAAVLSMVDPAQTQGADACAAAGPSADGGYAVLVWGTALAEVATAAGDVTVSGANSLTPVSRLVPDPNGWVRLQLPGAGTAHPRSRLDGGVVAGAGAVYAAEAAIEPHSEPVSFVADPPPLRLPDPGTPFTAVLLMPDASAEPVPAAPPKDDRVQVTGVLCKNGHFNDPNVNYCAVCGISMAQQTLVSLQGPRPPLGLLLLDDGSTFRLDADYVAGRDPGADPDVAAERARPLKLADGQVSRRHLRIALVGWEVQVVDLGSANGTAICLPGDPQPRRLAAHEPLVVRPGTRVEIGGRWFRYESNRNP